MKKMITMMAVVAMAVSMNAATFQWGVSTIFSDSKYGWDGSEYGPEYSSLINDGVGMYLFVVGYNASTSGFDFAYNTDGTTLMVKNTSGNWVTASSYLNLIDSYVTTTDDAEYATAFPLGIAFSDYTALFGSGASNWNQVGNYTLVMLTITGGLDGDYYNFYVGGPANFSEASGVTSTGSFAPEIYDAAGLGKITIIPEPATAMLALAGIGMLIAQKRKRA